MGLPHPTLCIRTGAELQFKHHFAEDSSEAIFNIQPFPISTRKNFCKKMATDKGVKVFYLSFKVRVHLIPNYYSGKPYLKLFRQ